MFEVCFQYDPDSTKWEVIVKGAKGELEARQGFNAVILTARMAIPSLAANKAEMLPNGDYKIIVGQ